MVNLIVYFSIGTLFGFIFRGLTSGFLIKTKKQREEEEYAEFSHIVIHELRAYLTNLAWVFEKLLDKELKNYSEEQYKTLILGRNTSENAINLINDTLNAISSGRPEAHFRFKLGDINNLIDGITSEYQLIAKQRNMNLVLEHSNIPIPLFYFDHSQLYLAIHGIIHNAMKYTKDGGEIKIKTEIFDDKVKIKISDNGIGIPKSEQSKIFSKFFRAENAKKLHENGSGLGMFITKNVISKHGGNISFTSEEDKGTTIEIILPIIKNEPK